MYNPCMASGIEEAKNQIDRILQSETLRSSPVLRRLLRFVADKTFSGEADALNEFSIGVDAFGKPSNYDPREDASVRLHISRIRQKLGDYYRNEGKDDLVVIEVPKGRFKLKWEVRSVPESAPRLESPPVELRQTDAYLRLAFLGLSGALLISMLWGSYLTIELSRARHNETPSVAWTRELEQLWQPFLNSKRPVVIAIADPLFIGLEGTDIFVRKVSIRRPEEATASSELVALRKTLGNPAIQPRYSFVPSGEVTSSFLLGKLLGTRRQDISLTGGSQVALRGLGESNVIVIGPEIMFVQKLAGIQLKPELTPTPGGIRNLHPRVGEPELFADAYPTSAPEDGEVFALVSRALGPLGKTNFESFTSSRTWGRQGAIQAFTDPTLARILFDHIKTPSGELPRCFQIVLKVKFRDAVPVDVSYVMHRVIG